MAPPLKRPPQETTENGATRQVGVELEFIGLESQPTAELVSRLYGGNIVKVDAHHYRVEETRFGDFEIELDTQYAHSKGIAQDQGAAAPSGTEPAAPPASDWGDRLEGQLRSAVGDVAKLWLPTEVSAPPIAWNELDRMEELIEGLREAGCEGSDASLLYAFGLQLNPEVPSFSADSLRRHLQAYLVLSAWLRVEIGLDLTRRLVPFVAPFPRGYALMVLREDYQPNLRGLILDYLDHNPTRNRELDMLPLFAHLDLRRVTAMVEDERIRARPTFHYRLPGTRLSEPGWGVSVEWNRWVEVERLAADEERLMEMAVAYRRHFDAPFASTEDWAARVRAWPGMGDGEADA
ncbi:MAG: amidoligase family protein [Rhodovibrionaceae bacterium]|nr:amidoligase family protein [Rhodovibrionaceae bacterium]